MTAEDDELSRERFGFTVFLSACVHAIIILGVGFTYLEELNSEPALEITMAQYRSEIAPDDADFLAQENQIGSGVLDEAAAPSTPYESDFNADEISLILKPAKLDARIKQANVELFNYVQTHLTGIQKQIDAAKEPRELKALRKAAAENAEAGVFSTASVAAAANMSLRTAQRITAEHGTTLQALIDKVREHRAVELLQDKRNDIGSIAFLLGYSDERAFCRAFQRWSGQTPSDYRRQLGKQIE